MSGKALLALGESVEQTLYGVALRQAGLEVSCVSTAAEAMQLCAEAGPFDLLLADVLIDGHGTGRAIAEQLQARCPSLRILFLSGCPLGHMLARGVLDAAVFAGGSAAFLRTPLPVPVLMGKVWGLLDATGALLTAANTSTWVRSQKTARRVSMSTLQLSAGAA